MQCLWRVNIFMNREWLSHYLAVVPLVLCKIVSGDMRIGTEISGSEGVYVCVCGRETIASLHCHN